MSNPLPLTISFGTLPNNGAGYTAQELTDLLGVNGRIFTEQAFALFTTGATAPTSDTGPWAKNGNTWYYWDTGTGVYVPFVVQPESLGYYVGSATPDQNVYSFWIELAGSGSPLALKTYFGGAWVDVYATLLSTYLTSAAFTAAIASYSTTAQMNAAIAAGTMASYPAQAELTSGPQAITLGAAAVKCTLNLAPLNPAPAPFSTVNSRYIAPADGVYSAGASVIFVNNTGTPSGMSITLRLYVNGADTGVFGYDGTPSPNGSQWHVAIPPILLDLNATDYVEFFVEATDGVDTGLLNLVNIDASFHRVSA